MNPTQLGNLVCKAIYGQDLVQLLVLHKCMYFDQLLKTAPTILHRSKHCNKIVAPELSCKHTWNSKHCQMCRFWEHSHTHDAQERQAQYLPCWKLAIHVIRTQQDLDPAYEPLSPAPTTTWCIDTCLCLYKIQSVVTVISRLQLPNESMQQHFPALKDQHAILEDLNNRFKCEEPQFQDGLCNTTIFASSFSNVIEEFLALLVVL